MGREGATKDEGWEGGNKGRIGVRKGRREQGEGGREGGREEAMMRRRERAGVEEGREG